jgi:hypothetical protein
MWRSLYRSLVGCLLYASVLSRTDITYDVAQLSRFLSNPGPNHCSQAIRVLTPLLDFVNPLKWNRSCCSGRPRYSSKVPHRRCDWISSIADSSQMSLSGPTHGLGVYVTVYIRTKGARPWSPRGWELLFRPDDGSYLQRI